MDDNTPSEKIDLDYSEMETDNYQLLHDVRNDSLKQATSTHADQEHTNNLVTDSSNQPTATSDNTNETIYKIVFDQTNSPAELSGLLQSTLKDEIDESLPSGMPIHQINLDSTEVLLTTDCQDENVQDLITYIIQNDLLNNASLLQADQIQINNVEALPFLSNVTNVEIVATEHNQALQVTNTTSTQDQHIILNEIESSGQIMLNFHQETSMKSEEQQYTISGTEPTVQDISNQQHLNFLNADQINPANVQIEFQMATDVLENINLSIDRNEGETNQLFSLSPTANIQYYEHIPKDDNIMPENFIPIKIQSTEATDSEIKIMPEQNIISMNNVNLIDCFTTLGNDGKTFLVFNNEKHEAAPVDSTENVEKAEEVVNVDKLLTNENSQEVVANDLLVTYDFQRGVEHGPEISFTYNDNKDGADNENCDVIALETLPLLNSCPATSLIPPLQVQASALVREVANVVPDFNTDEESIKILKFLEAAKPPQDEDLMLPQPKYEPPKIQCMYCKVEYALNAFKSHRCKQKAVNIQQPPPPLNQQRPVVTRKWKPTPFIQLDPPCLRSLRESQFRIHRFLKEELNYDIYKGVPPASEPGIENGTLICSLCDRRFVHASGLLRHMDKHAFDSIPTGTDNAGHTAKFMVGPQSLRVMLKCGFCGRLFFDLKTALQHFVTTHFSLNEPEIGIEEITDKGTANFKDNEHELLIKSFEQLHLVKKHCFEDNTVDRLVSMIEPVNVTAVLQCEFCEFIYLDIADLFAHVAGHKVEHAFTCNSCDIHVRNGRDIRAHWQIECIFARENLKTYGSELKHFFMCNVCEKYFISMELLHAHRYKTQHFIPRCSIQNGYRLCCEYCSKSFKLARDLMFHHTEKHANKKIRYASEYQHLRAKNSKPRDYLCEVCGKTYTQSSHLWQHLRFHNGVKPFACTEIGCNRKFTIRPDLNDHIRKCHTRERPFQCLECGKRFLTGSVYYQHRLIHRGERRYECEECLKRFYRADALKNHMRIHTGEKPFPCDYCTKRFRQRGDRDKHVRARHSQLDNKGRIMMQMHKLQLEAAQAAKAATVNREMITVQSINSFIKVDDENNVQIVAANEAELPLDDNFIDMMDVNDLISECSMELDEINLSSSSWFELK